MTERLATISPSRSGLSFALLSTALAAAIFFFDYSLPLGVAGGIPYVALVLIGAWSPRRHTLLVLAALSTSLVWLGYAVSPEGGEAWVVITNRSLALLAIWVTALLLFERKRADAALAKSNEHLERRVAERTAAIQAASESLIDEVRSRERAEESLRQSEARYHDLFHESPVSLWEEDWSAVKERIDALRDEGVTDFRAYFREHPEIVGELSRLTRPIDLNRATLAIYDETSKDSLASTFESYVNERPFPGFADRVASLAEGSLCGLGEGWIARRDGTAVYMRLAVAVPEACHDTWARVLGSTQDLTDWVRAEKALREGEQRLRLITDTVPVLIHYVDRDCRYRFCNKAYIDWFGLSPEDVVGRTIWDVVGEDVYAAAKDYVDRVLSGTPVSYENPVPYATLRGMRYARVTSVPDFGPDGEIRGAVAAVMDVTERKLAEAVLRESHDDLERRVAERTAELETANLQLRAEVAERERVSESLRRSEALLLTAQRVAKLGHWERNDRTGDFLWSDEVYEIVGLSPGEFTPTTDSLIGLIQPDDRNAVLSATQSIRDGAEGFSIDYRITRADGEIRHLHEIGHPVRDGDGRVIGISGTVQDITERKRLEQQLLQASKLATLGEMSAGIAHELNQPLNVIRMAADACLLLAAEGDINPEFQHGQLEVIGSQARRMTEIIDHMRVFGRIESGESITFDVADSVRAAVSLVLEQCRAEGIAVETVLPGEPRFIRGRPVRLEQVILNLLSNARDAVIERAEAGCADGASAGRIRVELVDGGDAHHVDIVVSDTGCGIPADALDRIFDPFFTTKEVGKGTGLGLSISYGIIADMGGRITASNGAEGARVEITLPAARDTQS